MHSELMRIKNTERWAMELWDMNRRTRQEIEERCGILAGQVDRLRNLFPMAQTIDEKPFHKDPASDLHCVPMEVLLAEIHNRLAGQGLLKRG